MKKGLAIALCIVLMVFAFSGCSNQASEGEYTIEEGKLTVAIDVPYGVMEYTNDQGEYEGFDIDLAKAFAEDLGVEAEFIPTAWEGIFLGLDSDKYDCVISSVSITQERLDDGNFLLTDAYLSNAIVIVTAPGDTSIQTMEDLKGKKVGVQMDTTADEAAEKVKESVEFDLQKFQTVDTPFLALKSGQIDCIVVDTTVAEPWCAQNPSDYAISSAKLTNEPIGVAVAKDNQKLQNKLNELIAQYKEDGTLKEISEKYFGADLTTEIDMELKSL